jgi:aldose sugar dehydrogenase
MTPVWTSGNVTVAPSGGTFVSGAQWRTWDGALVVACLDGSPSVGQRLLVMTLSADGSTTTAVVPQLVNSIRLRTAVQGPDGNLYVVTDVASGGGKILKVVPS